MPTPACMAYFNKRHRTQVLAEIQRLLPTVLPELASHKISKHSIRGGSTLGFACAGASESEQRAQGTWTSEAKALYSMPLTERLRFLQSVASRVVFSVASAGQIPGGPVDHRRPRLFPVITAAQTRVEEITDGQAMPTVKHRQE